MSYSKITLYRENAKKEKIVVIYYKNKSTVRHATAVTVKLSDFDKKANRVKPSDAEHERKNEIIKRVHDTVEEIIVDYLSEHAIKPEGEFVKKQLQLSTDSIRLKSNSELTDYYQNFIQAKTLFFGSPDRSMASLKDYKSTLNALLDYKQVVQSIPLNAINSSDWLEKFNQFLSKDRPKVYGYTFITSKQTSKTRHKRFICLKVFAKWLVSEQIITNYDILSSYQIRVIKTDHYALNLEEVKLLQSTTFEKDTYQKAIDLFVFACHTGLRISDVRRIKKTMVKTKKNTLILELNTQKTKTKAEIPLSKFAHHILEKYNYNLKLYSEANTNAYIHEALRTITAFNEPYVYGSENEDAPKYKLITFHTGRRTFITNLVNNNVNLNAIMKMTGHRKISTLQEYINPNYELVIENIRVFNNLEI